MPSANITKPLPTTLRDLLLAAGVGQFVAPLAIQFMSFLPRTCDPYAQGVIILNQGLARLLNAHGASLPIDGNMSSEMTRELMKYSGPRWYDKNWQTLYQEAYVGKPWGGWKRLDRGVPAPQSVSGYDFQMPMSGVMEFATSPVGLVALAVGGVMTYNHFKKRKRSR